MRFEIVQIKGTKRWTDSDGKRRQETKTFMQTLNPFNKNAYGLPKSRAEIQAELLVERKEWLAIGYEKGNG